MKQAFFIQLTLQGSWGSVKIDGAILGRAH